MVEETDKHKKEKTKRRYQPLPKADKKPPINITNIRTMNVESLEEGLVDFDDNATTIVFPRSLQRPD